MDAIVLRYETGKLPSEVNLKAMFPKNEGVQRKIARLYRRVLFDLYGEDVQEEKLVQTMADAHQVFALVTDRTGLKKKLFSWVERNRPSVIGSHIVPLTEAEDIDYANTQNSPWGEEAPVRAFLSFMARPREWQENPFRLFGG